MRALLDIKVAMTGCAESAADLAVEVERHIAKDREIAEQLRSLAGRQIDPAEREQLRQLALRLEE